MSTCRTTYRLLGVVARHLRTWETRLLYRLVVMIWMEWSAGTRAIIVGACSDANGSLAMPRPLSPREQVVVVGAGMAGLSATRQLRQKGWPEDKVVLLEGSGDIGGRVS